VASDHGAALPRSLAGGGERHDMKLSDDDFTLMGLPQRQALARDDLDERRRALQAQVHPDRFAAQGAAAQRVAMQWAVRVNEAYQRLREPLSRAAYLCELRGAPVRRDDNTAMPAAFLARQMHWHEALADAATAQEVQLVEAEVVLEEAALHTELTRQLDERLDIKRAAEIVRALMFIARLHQDVERRIDRLTVDH
jgi:molecular chaperone HscB